jgi:hypothetical protein
MMWCSSRISLLSFCLDDLSICDWELLKSLTTTVLESIYALGPSEYVWWKWVHWH